MKTKQELLDFFEVKLNKLYSFSGNIPFGMPRYFRVKEIKNRSTEKKELVIQTRLDFPDSANDWDYYHSEEPISFLSNYEYKLAPLRPVLKDEKLYFMKIIWPLSHEIEYITKKGEGDKEWIEICTCPEPEEGYEKEIVTLYKFQKGTEYKRMKKNKKYSLDDLEIDQPVKVVMAKYEKKLKENKA